MRHVILLRGINVGGKNVLPMRGLVELLEEAGATRVVTYIQSGNVVFDASAKAALRIASDLPGIIERAAELTVPVVLRSSVELVAALEKNPYLARGVDDDQLHVAFLAKGPTAAAAARLDPARSPPDELTLVGRELFLWLPNGVGKSKITNVYLDSRLETVSTVRNLRTVRKLCELASA